MITFLPAHDIENEPPTWTHYLKGGIAVTVSSEGLFWDIDLFKSSPALDFEYFYQISDILPDESTLTRYEVSAELNIPLSMNYILTLGYEEEFLISADIRNVRSFYIALGFKRLLPIKI